MTSWPGPTASAVGRAGLAATGASVALTVTVAVAGPSVVEPLLVGRSGLPSWALTAHPSPYLAVGLTAVALAVGALGLTLTLRAIRGGWSVQARAVLLAGLLAAAVLTHSGRLGSNVGTSDQSLRGLLLRAFLPGTPPGLIWAAVAAAVAVGGFGLARRLARDSREMEAIAVVALVGVLASPVSWIHHYVVVVVAIGAILADGRAPRRVALAAGTAMYFTLAVPWWGQSLLGQRDVLALAARVVQDSFAIAALALIVVLARLPAATPRAPAGRKERGEVRKLCAAGLIPRVLA